jgi:4-aminobutyrate aminotransferase
VGLLDRLLKISPPSLTRFFFANSGSEAVDNAIKIARGHTKRQNIICFEVCPQILTLHFTSDAA